MALVSHPTPLMLALSEAVSTLDPSVPAPAHAPSEKIELNAEHWEAVASYAEAFPSALAKRVMPGKVGTPKPSDKMVHGLGLRIVAEAKDIRETLAEPSAAQLSQQSGAPKL